MNWVVEILVFSIMVVILQFFLSALFLPIFFGIPKTKELVKLKILNKENRSYVPTILLWVSIIFVISYFILKYSSEEIKELYAFAFFLSVIISYFGITSDKHKDKNLIDLFKFQQDYITDLPEKIYSKSLEIVEKNNDLLKKYNYDSYIDVNVFVAMSCLFNLFYIEKYLRMIKKYSVSDNFIIVYLYIIELTSHLENVTVDDMMQTYLEIKNLILNAEKNVDGSENSIEEVIGANYIYITLPSFDAEDIETWLLIDIYNNFLLIENFIKEL